MKVKHYLLALAAGVFIALPAMGDLGRYIWGAAFAGLAAVLLAVGAANAEERKKKEHQARCIKVNALRAEVEKLEEAQTEMESKIEALHKENTTAPPSTPGKKTGNAEGVDLSAVPGEWSAGRRETVGVPHKTGNALELEINEE